LLAERRGRLAGAGETDDQHRLLLAAPGRLRGERLEPGVEGETATVVNEAVPHAETAHLRLPEVVGAEDTRRPILQVDDDQPTVGLARSRETRRVDHRELGLRSEEHTSELQSRENLVCRLLLEK